MASAHTTGGRGREQCWDPLVGSSSDSALEWPTQGSDARSQLCSCPANCVLARPYFRGAISAPPHFLRPWARLGQDRANELARAHNWPTRAQERENESQNLNFGQTWNREPRI